MNEFDYSLRNFLSETFRKVLREELQATTSEKAPKKRFVDIQKAAEHIDLAVPTVYGLVHRELIPFSKRGNRLYFDLDELDGWIAAGRSSVK